MKQDRIDRFFSGPESFIVKPKHGEPYRPDGKPLDDGDREMLAGRDPLAAPAEKLIAEAGRRAIERQTGG
jgi:hypothetical protein